MLCYFILEMQFGCPQPEKQCSPDPLRSLATRAGWVTLVFADGHTASNAPDLF